MLMMRVFLVSGTVIAAIIGYYLLGHYDLNEEKLAQLKNKTRTPSSST